MSEKRAEPREVGLKAIREVRSDRGRKRLSRITGPIALVVGGAVSLTLAGSWFIQERSLINRKEDLLKQQRAAVATVGAEWVPIRDQVEKLTMEAASAPFPGDMVASEAPSWDFRTSPGLYLRARVEDAMKPETLRDAVRESVRDSFASCLLRPTSTTIAALAQGLDAGPPAMADDQPWNLRQGYTSTHVLEDAWANEVKAAKDELTVRVFEIQYDKAQKEEIPVAINIVKRAQFFLLVLDEDVPAAAELARVANDGGGITEAEIQQVPHPARVYLIDLETNKEMVRLRRTVDPDLGAGQHTVRDPEVRASLRRQINNCALAQSVLGAIDASKGAARP